MKRFLSLFLALIVAVGICLSAPIIIEAEAASWSSDYKYWSQGASDEANMRSGGCWITADAKMIYETGINRNSSFNPDVLKDWYRANGYISTGGVGKLGNVTYSPVAYAKSLGNNGLEFLGTTTTNTTDKIWSNINNGYYSIAERTDGTHYFLIDNESSKKNGVIWIYDSWSERASYGPRKNPYGIEKVYTYKYDGGTTPNPAETPIVKLSKTSLAYGETATVTWNSCARATRYWLSCWKEGEGGYQRLTYAVSGFSKTINTSDDILEPGNYSITICSYDQYNRESVGNWVKITVLPKNYTVSYNANGGSNPPSSQTKTHGTNLTLSTTKPTKTGYTFKGWGTSASDTSVDYAAGATYSSNANITLYAIWSANNYTITYNANGGSNAPSSQTKVYGTNLTLSSDEPTRTGYNFLGWGTSSGDTTVNYAPGDTYSANESKTLYAIWEIITSPLYYRSASEEEVTNLPESQIKVYGEDLILSTQIPKRAGYKFSHWRAINGDKGNFMPGDVYTYNYGTILVAEWVEAETYVIYYDANEGREAPRLQDKLEGEEIRLSSQIPYRPGYKFLGWSTSPIKYEGNMNEHDLRWYVEFDGGELYREDRDLYLFAVWMCEHDEVRNINEKNPTCTKDGYSGDVVCSTCRTVLQEGDIIEAKGHNTSVVNAKVATCTAEGYTGDTYCSTCKTTISKGTAIAKTAHKTTVVNAKTATCTSTGYTGDTKCTVCGTVTVKGTTIAKLGHSTSIINKKSATCTATGYTGDTYCSTCKTTISKGTAIAKTAHKTTVINAKTATCTSTGYTGDTKCTVCGTVTAKGTTIAKVAHKTTVINAKSATIEVAGYTGDKYCSLCQTVVEKGKEIPKLGVSLTTPTVSIKNTAKGIQVNWNKIENAQSYIVYRRVYNASTKKWGGWSKLKTGVTGTSYVDSTVKLGTQYRYTVRAVNGSVMSKYTSTATLKYNVTPTVKIANASTGIKVSWSTVANATGYTVYSSTYNAKTKKWSGWKNRGTTKATTTSWVDKSVKSGTYYKYTVRACNGKSIKSSYKGTSGLLFLSQPTVKIANAATGVKVSWNKVTGATGYTVYRSEYKNGAWTGWSNRGTAKSNKISWTDTKVTSGVQYKYTVRAVKGDYKSSYKASNTIKFTSTTTTKDAEKFLYSTMGKWTCEAFPLLSKNPETYTATDILYMIYSERTITNNLAYSSYITGTNTSINKIMSESEYNKYVKGNAYKYGFWVVYQPGEIQSKLNSTWTPGRYSEKKMADGKYIVETSKGYIMVFTEGMGGGYNEYFAKVKNCVKNGNKYTMDVYILDFAVMEGYIYDYSKGNKIATSHTYSYTSFDNICSKENISLNKLGTIKVVVVETSSGLRLQSIG